MCYSCFILYLTVLLVHLFFFFFFFSSRRRHTRSLCDWSSDVCSSDLQFLDQAVTSVALVSDSEIARRAVSTVDEAVNKAPGVLFLNGQVNIRGSSGFVEGLGSRVLLLVDGVPANQGDRGGIDWDMLPLDQVDRVEVVKGAGSSLYGSAAFGGVVNLITHDIPVGVHGRVRATAGASANPPESVWQFRDYTGGLGGLDVTGSYASQAP